MGRSLEMAVVAEGIETPAQHDALRETGCELGQGFLFARPMPAGEMAERLAGAADDR